MRGMRKTVAFKRSMLDAGYKMLVKDPVFSGDIQ